MIGGTMIALSLLAVEIQRTAALDRRLIYPSPVVRLDAEDRKGPYCRRESAHEWVCGYTSRNACRMSLRLVRSPYSYCKRF